jgi:hypothetical protein
MLTATGGRIVTVAVLDFSGFATEVAVTVTVAGVGTVPGALYTPEEEITPHAAPEQPLPATLHVTVVSLAPVTTATNPCWWPTTTPALAGETETAAFRAVPT